MNIPLNIDWQQILLHLFNFVILAGGLYFILYKPVKEFMEKREQYYREMDDEANKKLSDAKKLNAEYIKKIFSAEEDMKVEKMRNSKEARISADKIINEAEKKAEKIVSDAEKKAEAAEKKHIEEAEQEIKHLAEEAAEKMVLGSDKDALEKFLEESESGDISER